MEENLNQNSCLISINSRKKLFYLGLAIAILNPIFSGLVFGVFLLDEPKFRKEARIITFVSVIWGLISLYAVYYLQKYGYLRQW